MCSIVVFLVGIVREKLKKTIHELSMSKVQYGGKILESTRVIVLVVFNYLIGFEMKIKWYHVC